MSYLDPIPCGKSDTGKPGNNSALGHGISLERQQLDSRHFSWVDWLEFGSSWLTAVSKIKSAGERKHPPCAPSLTKANLISSLVSHREEQKFICLEWKTWDEP